MLIYLVRHGDALPAEDDPKRPLSPKGRNEVEGTVRELRAEGAKISEIWHSGKLRAKQTAQIIAQDLGVKVVVEKAGLMPDDDPALIAELLRQASSGGDARFVVSGASRVSQDAGRNPPRNRITHNASHSILLAGHLPFLPKLANLLDPKMGVKEMRTGGVVRVEY